MKCPVCNGVELKIADRQGIEIDYCPQCRGIWLDRGELDKIVERSYSQVVPNVASQPVMDAGYQSQHRSRHHDDHHGADHHYRPSGYHQRKSWLSELFD